MPSGPRIRANNVFGTILDNPLTNVATTINSAGLANLPAVSSAHAIIVLDPRRVYGAPEIIVVTAHTAAATSATVTRGQYGTAARAHPLGAEWIHSPIDEDFIEVLTSGAPSDPYEGQLWYRSDTDIYMAYTGAAAIEALPIGAWQNWTPVVNQPGPIAATIQHARYTRLGRLVIAHARLQLTAAGTANNVVFVSIPVPGLLSPVSRQYGSGSIIDVTVNTYIGVWMGDSGLGAVALISDSSTNNGIAWGQQPNVALAANDVIVLNLAYEAAS